MRAIVVSMLAGGLLFSACGGGGGDGADDAPGTGGAINPVRTGGAGGSKPGSGGAGPAQGGSGGSAGTGGALGTGGAGGAAATGGATGEGGNEADAGAAPGSDAGSSETAPPAPVGDGGLGPNSPDDSPPLVLPGSKLIFDGKTLTGWTCDTAVWSVKEGAIDATGTGNNFCNTNDDHDSFRLTGKSRVVKDPANHAGIGFWGGRAKGCGGCLQITPASGSLWDYGGGGGVRTNPRTVDYTKWSFFELIVNAKTGVVKIAVNGHAYPDYTAKAGRAKKAAIGLQLHAKPNEVQYKDLALEDNPADETLLTAIPGK
jgi:hypothetical protein